MTLTKKKPLFLALLASASIILAGCDEFEALPTPETYDAPILNLVDDGLYQNRLGEIYDALVSSGDTNSERVLKNVLYIYATSPTIECTEETSGDVDARGIMQGIAFEHPGDSADVKNFTEVYLNKGVIILTRSCDGSEAGRYKYFGNTCNPLFLSVERTDTKEANKRKFTFKQEIAGKFLPGEYSGALPTLAKTSAELAAEEDEGV